MPRDVAYFDTASSPSPFAHLWSLAIEEQILPAVAARALRSLPPHPRSPRTARRGHRRAGRRVGRRDGPHPQPRGRLPRHPHPRPGPAARRAPRGPHPTHHRRRRAAGGTRVGRRRRGRRRRTGRDGRARARRGHVDVPRRLHAGRPARRPRRGSRGARCRSAGPGHPPPPAARARHGVLRPLLVPLAGHRLPQRGAHRPRRVDARCRPPCRGRGCHHRVLPAHRAAHPRWPLAGVGRADRRSPRGRSSCVAARDHRPGRDRRAARTCGDPRPRRPSRSATPPPRSSCRIGPSPRRRPSRRTRRPRRRRRRSVNRRTAS